MGTYYLNEKETILVEMEKLLKQSKEISALHNDFRDRLFKLQRSITKLETGNEQTDRLLQTIRDKVVPVQVPYYAPPVQPYYQPPRLDWQPVRPWAVTCSGTAGE